MIKELMKTLSERRVMLNSNGDLVFYTKGLRTGDTSKLYLIKSDYEYHYEKHLEQHLLNQVFFSLFYSLFPSNASSALFHQNVSSGGKT